MMYDIFGTKTVMAACAWISNSKHWFTSFFFSFFFSSFFFFLFLRKVPESGARSVRGYVSSKSTHNYTEGEVPSWPIRPGHVQCEHE